MSGSQLWTVAQLENKLIDMREMYNDKLNGVIRYFLISEKKKRFFLYKIVKCVNPRESSCASSPEGSPSHSVPQSSLDEVMIDPFFESQVCLQMN